MNTLDIIAKKRDGQSLTSEEIDYLVHGYSRNIIPDYQMSAFLMAVYLNGMTFQETADLTSSMLHSGSRMNFSQVRGRKIDKHSTGGVGDKVSLILAPLAAAAGVRVPMISGRGLGHSGGTLDKLESIPGFRTDFSEDEFYKQVEASGVAMIGQTQSIAPADKKIYALRDATATVASIPLITASILCKKLAEGLDGLVMDVKVGKGAFMRTLPDAEALAKSITKTAELNGLSVTTFITRMDQPLGYAAGNWLEVKEVIDCLQGNGPQDLMEVTFALTAEMLVQAGRATSTKNALEILQNLIVEGIAFQKFIDIVKDQGGQTEVIHQPDTYPQAKIKQQVFAPHSGFIQEVNALNIGVAVIEAGGGRRVKEDAIDYKAGIVLFKKIGDAVEKNEPIAEFHTDLDQQCDTISHLVKSAFTISDDPVDPLPIIVSKQGA